MSNNLRTRRTAIAASISALVLGCTVIASTQAATRIPEKGGWSGHVALGVGAVDMETNMIATIMSGNIDLGEEEISDLNNSPDSESSGIPAINFEIAYTFESTRTQLHLGNQTDDYLRFNMVQVFGLRQDMGVAGEAGINGRFTTIPAEVWEDPYATNVKRKETDRDSGGFQLYWKQIMSSGLELSYTADNEDIDKERSGEALGLSSSQRKLLQRDGDRYRFDMRYEFATSDDRHIITPGLSWIDNDLDGDAMAHDGAGAEITYLYKRNEHWRYLMKASYADLDFSAENPIYAERDSVERYGGSFTASYKEPFGWENWDGNVTAGWYNADHDIDFYDSTVTIFTVGVFRKF